MAIFIGIEGTGMRKSLAVAADERGNVIGAACVPYGMSLHAISRDLLRSRLRRLLQEVARSAGRDLNRLDDAHVCIGLTGVTFPYDALVDLPQEVRALRVNFASLTCIGDGEIAIAAAVHQFPAATIICHMGSTACVITGPGKDERTRIGGWGPAIGDEGSGYWLGRLVLRSIGEEYESGKPESYLWREICSWLSEPDREIESWVEASTIWKRIINGFHQANLADTRPALFAFAHAVTRESAGQWREVASSLTIPLFREFESSRPCEVAKRIIDQAVLHLTDQLDQALKVSKMQGSSIPIVLHGGVFTHHLQFREILIQNIRQRFLEIHQFVYPGQPGSMRPAFGALLYALAGSTYMNLKLPDAAIINRLVVEQASLHSQGILKYD